MPAKINEDASRISFTSYPASLITGDGNYSVGFEVFDMAGNIATTTSSFVVDNIMPEGVFSHVYNPITDNWDDYVPGMIVHSNPAKMRFRRKKADYPTFNGNANKGWDDRGYHHEDEEYIYNNYTVYSPVSNTYQVFLTKASVTQTVRQSHANIVMAEGVAIAPESDNVSLKAKGESDYRVGGRTWVSIRMNTPTTLTDVRVKVKPRSYEQKVDVSRGGSCIVPAFQTECNVSFEAFYDSGKAYTNMPIYLRSSVDGVKDGKFSVHVGYVLIYYDFNGGEFLSHKIENKQIEFTYLDLDRTNDWRSGMWYTPSVKLHAKNVIDNTVTVINLDDYVETTYNQYKGSVDASGLAEGNYNLSLVATDSYGNETKESVAKNILIDNTAPKITIMDKGLESFGEVFGLDNIDIILEDIDTAAITEIILKEGPLNNVVNMSWREIENKSFKLEYPKIFPSLTDDEKYKLIVKANDSSGNTSEKEITFIYKPLELREKEPINIITTTEPLRNKEGTIVNLIKEKNIRNRDGILVTGPYLADFTLSSSSEFSVSIMARTSGITGSRNEIVNPGQTIRVPIMLTEGELKFGITQVAKQEGTIKYLLEILDI